MRLALLASGTLGLNAVKQIFTSEHTLVAVLTDKTSIAIQEYCVENDIPLFTGNPRMRKCLFPQQMEVDILLSVSYLFLIDKDLFEWPKVLAMNIHGSLLPKYRGRTPHVWAIINGEQETGITAHVIDAGCDTGDILLQRSVSISECDTGASLLEKYTTEYPHLIEELLQKVQSGNISPRKQAEGEATYYGKRTPSDGLIDWSWQRKQIRNWVRAQAFPYPGAFTHCRGQKIIINQAFYSDFNYHCFNQNGEVLVVNDSTVVVKTPDGALALTDIVLPKGFVLQKGDILY